MGKVIFRYEVAFPRLAKRFFHPECPLIANLIFIQRTARDLVRQGREGKVPQPSIQKRGICWLLSVPALSPARN